MLPPPIMANKYLPNSSRRLVLPTVVRKVVRRLICQVVKTASKNASRRAAMRLQPRNKNRYKLSTSTNKPSTPAIANCRCSGLRGRREKKEGIDVLILIDVQNVMANYPTRGLHDVIRSIHIGWMAMPYSSLDLPFAQDA